jgi:hypothetical protein
MQVVLVQLEPIGGSTVLQFIERSKLKVTNTVGKTRSDLNTWYAGSLILIN